jgi:short subunit dehydrogenase-like uncharacterized protein
VTWRQGRAPYLERVVQASLGKISTAMRALPRWARAQGLQPRETAYVARTRDRRTLRFSASGNPSIERAYRTHWVSSALSEAKRARLDEQASRPPDLVAVSPLKDHHRGRRSSSKSAAARRQPHPAALLGLDLVEDLADRGPCSEPPQLSRQLLLQTTGGCARPGAATLRGRPRERPAQEHSARLHSDCTSTAWRDG